MARPESPVGVALRAWCDYGVIRYEPTRGLLELEWLPRAMTDDDFKHQLERLAAQALSQRSPLLLVDMSHFSHRPGADVMPWRDATIVPRYNAAGVKRFAFILPSGSAAPSAPPAPEGPANFPTGYFTNRKDAESWLAGD